MHTIISCIDVMIIIAICPVVTNNNPIPAQPPSHPPSLTT